MDKIEARRVLNRLQFVCKRLKMLLKGKLSVSFIAQDDIYKASDDASYLLAYCQIVNDEQIMKECALLPRYLFYQYFSIAKENNYNYVALLNNLTGAARYLLEIETLYICTRWGLTKEEATKYYIDTADGLCKSRETKEELQPEAGQEPEAEQQPEAPTSNEPPILPRKRGRKVEPFESVLVGDDERKQAIKKRLHALIDDKRDSKAVLYIKVAVCGGMIQKPTYTQFTKEFGSVASRQIYNKYMSNNKYTDDEIKGAEAALKAE